MSDKVQVILGGKTISRDDPKVAAWYVLDKGKRVDAGYYGNIDNPKLTKFIDSLTEEEEVERAALDPKEPGRWITLRDGKRIFIPAENLKNPAAAAEEDLKKRERWIMGLGLGVAFGSMLLGSYAAGWLNKLARSMKARNVGELSHFIGKANIINTHKGLEKVNNKLINPIIPAGQKNWKIPVNHFRNVDFIRLKPTEKWGSTVMKHFGAQSRAVYVDSADTLIYVPKAVETGVADLGESQVYTAVGHELGRRLHRLAPPAKMDYFKKVLFPKYERMFRENIPPGYPQHVIDGYLLDPQEVFARAYTQRYLNSSREFLIWKTHRIPVELREIGEWQHQEFAGFWPHRAAPRRRPRKRRR
jgi:hypothetical protein